MGNDGIELAPISTWERDGNLKVLVSAAQQLRHRPKITAKNLVVAPESQRKAAEESIVTAVNLIAVGQGCRRTISSPTPCLVFVATSVEAAGWLAQRSGLHRSPLRNTTHTFERMDLDESAVAELTDRTDGAALLVEALAHDHPMGRFHDLVRLFERAFATPPGKLTDPVVAFLDPRFGYSRDEVADWFEKMRGPATHADVRDVFLVETDVQPVVGRMEQAAQDVLFNKATWRDPGASRRRVWMPRCGTSDNRGSVFITQGSEGALTQRLLDEYAAFPLDLEGIIVAPPADWWPRDGAALQTAEAGVNIIANDGVG